MALNTWYTHCGSTNHGMMIKWYTTDSDTANLRMEMTQYLQADLQTWSNNSATAKYYLNPTTYLDAANDFYFVNTSTLSAATTLATTDDVP